MKDGVTKTLKVDATLNYSKQWNKHLLFANLNWNMQQNSYEWHSMEAWGFLNNKVDQRLHLPNNMRRTAVRGAMRKLLVKWVLSEP